MKISVSGTPTPITSPQNGIHSIETDIDIDIDISIDELRFFHANYPDIFESVLSIVKEKK